MKRLPFVLGALVACSVPSFAQEEDPVAIRQALMQNMASAATVSGGVMKGELPYNAAVGKAAITAMNATALTYGEYFPEGSDQDSRSEAAPTVWTDRPGFEEQLARLQAATAAAVQAAGREGPADAAAFAAAVQPVLGTCRTCHETYRIDN